MDRKKRTKIWTDVNEILDILFSDKSNDLEGATAPDEVEVETDEDLLDVESESSDEYDSESFTEEVEKEYNDNLLGKGEVEVNMEVDFMLPVIASDGNNAITTVPIYSPIITTTVDLQTDNFVDSVVDIHSDSVLTCSVDNDIDNDVNTASSINTTTNFDISHDDPMEICIDTVDNEEPAQEIEIQVVLKVLMKNLNLIRKWSEVRKAQRRIVRGKIQQEVLVCQGHQRKHGPQGGAFVCRIRGPRVPGGGV